MIARSCRPAPTGARQEGARGGLLMTGLVGHGSLVLALLLAAWGMVGPMLWARTGPRSLGPARRLSTAGSDALRARGRGDRLRHRPRRRRSAGAPGGDPPAPTPRYNL